MRLEQRREIAGAPCAEVLAHHATPASPRPRRPGRSAYGIAPSSLTLTSRRPSPSISRTTSSPAPSGPTPAGVPVAMTSDRKSTRLHSSHVATSYAVFDLHKPPKLLPP